MARQQVPLDYLSNYVPAPAVPGILHYLHHYRVHLTITRERKSVHGDYRHPSPGKTHRISVNSSLNPFAFLITLIHELAHLVTFTENGPQVAPHGREWKKNYAVLLQEFIARNIFPDDILAALRENLHNLPASSCSDESLTRVLKRYDPLNPATALVENLPEGATFAIEEDRLFLKGKRLRKRYQCVEVATGREYLFSPVYEVRVVACQ